MKVLIFEELKRTRVLVAKMWKERGYYCFKYKKEYLERAVPTPIGPELPLKLKTIKSKSFFQSLEDVMPDRKNAAYKDYCKQAGISLEETDKLKLLTTIGKRGASKFVFEEEREVKEASGDRIKKFREELGLSQRDFALFFEIPIISLQKLEKGVVGQKIAKNYLENYINNPKQLKNLLKKRGYWLHSDKVKAIMKFVGKKYPRIDLCATVVLYRSFMLNEIENLKKIDKSLIESNNLKNEQESATRGLMLNNAVMVSGKLCDLIEYLENYPTVELTWSDEIEKFISHYNSHIRNFRNFLVAHLPRVENYNFKKGPSATKAFSQIDSYINSARHLFSSKINMRDFLNLIIEILDQLKKALPGVCDKK